MPKAVTIVRADLTATGLRQAAAWSDDANAARRMLGLALGSKDIRAAKPPGSAAWTDRRCATGLFATMPKALLGCPIAPNCHTRLGVGQSLMPLVLDPT